MLTACCIQRMLTVAMQRKPAYRRMLCSAPLHSLFSLQVKAKKAAGHDTPHLKNKTVKHI